VLGAASLFLRKSLWRIAGMQSAGRALVRALGDPDEDLRVMAGMFLVQAGSKAEPLLEEALKRRENLPLVLSVLADIGNRRFETEIRQFVQDGDPQVAKAAQDALRLLASH
jgi:hypothetical protein